MPDLSGVGIIISYRLRNGNGQALAHLAAVVGEVLKRWAICFQVCPWVRARRIFTLLLSVRFQMRTRGNRRRTASNAKAVQVVMIQLLIGCVDRRAMLNPEDFLILALLLRNGKRQAKASCCIAAASFFLPHWSPIASATPSKVRLSSFQRSGLGGIKWTRCSLPSTQFAGLSLGKLCSQRQVAFTSPCPYSQG